MLHGAAIAFLLCAAGRVAATTCADICAPLPQTCIVSALVNVAPGSVIDCGTRPVQVSGGNLRVTNGSFTLKAGSLSVTNGRKLESICSGTVRSHGFVVQTTGAISSSGNGSGFVATCTTRGGRVTLLAGGPVTLGGTGINASGTTTTGRGGFIRIDAAGAVTTTANLRADAATTSGPGVPGGGIDIKGQSISIGADLTVSGYIDPGAQAIRLRAAQDILITGGIVNASTGNGDGGQVTMDAGGVLDIRRPVKANGAGANALGGVVDLRGDSVAITRDVLAHGGSQGGTIFIEARKKADLGTGATQAFQIEADRSSNNPGYGGEISITSQGHDVALGPQLNLHASAALGGQGGFIVISGVAVTAAGGSQVIADGSSGAGGSIEISARGQLTLNGILHANNGEAIFYHRTDGEVIGSGVTGAWSEEIDDDLDPPCGDGIRRDPDEQCDDPDLGSATCCTATCTVCP